MTQYKIQVGSWTKLPDGEVQEDTRDIMEMMADKFGGNVEGTLSRLGSLWEHIGVAKDHFILVYDNTYVQCDLLNKQSLFIPYAELQKMLNQKPKKVTSLLNTKLDCRKPDGTVDEELSRAYQETCFEQGIPSGSILNNRKFLFNTAGNGATWSASEAYFNNHPSKQINFTYTRKLDWEATVVEPTTPEPVDEMVNICGVEYSAKELNAALELIKKSRKE